MTTINLGRIILLIVSLFFISTGLVLMFSPESMLTHMFIGTVDSVAGLSSIRAIWASSIIAVWGTVFYAALKSNRDLALIGIVSLLLVLLGRLAGIFSDGLFPELSASVLPTVMAIILMLVAFKLMKNTTRA